MPAGFHHGENQLIPTSGIHLPTGEYHFWEENQSLASTSASFWRDQFSIKSCLTSCKLSGDPASPSVDSRHSCARHAGGSQEKIFDKSRSHDKASCKVWDPAGYHDKKHSRIHDPTLYYNRKCVGSHVKKHDRIYDPMGSHDINAVVCSVM